MYVCMYVMLWNFHFSLANIRSERVQSDFSHDCHSTDKT